MHRPKPGAVPSIGLIVPSMAVPIADASVGLKMADCLDEMGGLSQVKCLKLEKRYLTTRGRVPNMGLVDLDNPLKIQSEKWVLWLGTSCEESKTLAFSSYF